MINIHNYLAMSYEATDCGVVVKLNKGKVSLFVSSHIDLNVVNKIRGTLVNITQRIDNLNIKSRTPS